MRKYTQAIILLAFFIGSWQCEKKNDRNPFFLKEIASDYYYSSEIFQSSNAGVYGKWKIFETSGGKDGKGIQPSFEFLEIKPIGIYGFVRNDSIIEYGKIVVQEQTAEALLISLDPAEDSGIVMYDSEKYIDFSGNDTLNLIAPCCDRINFHFVRIE